jgi:hypothetical protein
MLRRKGAELIHRRPYIQKGSRPSAPGLAQPTIFDIQSCEARAFERIGHWSNCT